MGNPIPYMDGARPIMATIERYGGFQDSNFIVRQRAWGTYRRPDRFGIRAYTEFCPHGDLDLAITINGKRADADEDVQVPEPFIWLVIRNISEAIYYLQLGYFFDEKDSPDRPPPRDVPLIHLDIKPGNIFLDTPISPYLLYPNPKLADFDDHIEANPEALQTIEFWGTKSWQPPVRSILPHMNDRFLTI
ncbi:hypothetical protein P154DRAFT_151154 [Amniculicola lignicola CBS 123094]|uniref:Protein kinase domain-containing protein n=1 Tax=Amniculicola lignicola CBS 123094 TaxID=1392246 RepID=A0A6A5WJQ3_9PLEO|nr:hypothetical protein P154DRAFT_151154 [Amniculicola lignicola CBS 123094]